MARLEEHAFMSNAMPCNSIPFLRRIIEIMEENKTNNFEALPEEARLAAEACLWIVNAQLYGEMSTIDMSDVFYKLYKKASYGIF